MGLHKRHITSGLSSVCLERHNKTRKPLHKQTVVGDTVVNTNKRETVPATSGESLLCVDFVWCRQAIQKNEDLLIQEAIEEADSLVSPKSLLRSTAPCLKLVIAGDGAVGKVRCDKLTLVVYA